MALCLLYPLCLLCPTLHGMPPGTQVQLPPSQPLLDPLVMLQHDWNAHQPRFFRGEMSLRSTRWQKLQLTASHYRWQMSDTVIHQDTFAQCHVFTINSSCHMQNLPVTKTLLWVEKEIEHAETSFTSTERIQNGTTFQDAARSQVHLAIARSSQASHRGLLRFNWFFWHQLRLRIWFKSCLKLLECWCMYIYIYSIHIYNHIHLYTSIFIYYTVMYICFQNIHWKSKSSYSHTH